jgi:hypothetical protein
MGGSSSSGRVLLAIWRVETHVRARVLLIINPSSIHPCRSREGWQLRCRWALAMPPGVGRVGRVGTLAFPDPSLPFHPTTQTMGSEFRGYHLAVPPLLHAAYFTPGFCQFSCPRRCSKATATLPPQPRSLSPRRSLLVTIPYVLSICGPKAGVHHTGGDALGR